MTVALSVVRTSRRASGPDVSAGTFPGSIAGVVASPSGELAGTSGGASEQSFSSGSLYSPLIEQVVHRMTVSDPTGQPNPTTAYVGGWLRSSITSGPANSVGHLIRLPDVSSFTAEWFTPTELAAGTLLFSGGAPSTDGGTAYRFDVTFAMDPSMIARVVVVSDASLNGEGYDPADWSFHTVYSTSGGSGAGAFEYAYVADPPPPAWPLHVVDTAADGGTVWRVGPDSNPDGGLLRLVEADGTRWVQGIGASGPMETILHPTSIRQVLVSEFAVHGLSGGQTLTDVAPTIAGGDSALFSDDGDGSYVEETATDNGYGTFTQSVWLATFPALPEAAADPGVTIEILWAARLTTAERTDATITTPASLGQWDGVNEVSGGAGRTLRFVNPDGDPAPTTTTDFAPGAYTGYVGSELHDTPPGVADEGFPGLLNGEIGLISGGYSDYAVSGGHAWLANHNRRWTYLALRVTWTGATSRPLSVVDTDGTVLTVLPMKPDVPPAWTQADAWGGWVWDAGEYLPAAFSSLSGFPATLPVGAQELDFKVLPSSKTVADFVAGTPDTTPRGDSWIYDNGGGTTSGWSASPGGSSPDAGSHLFAIWYGPNYNTSDPAPTGNPATLVPAALAQFGTA